MKPVSVSYYQFDDNIVCNTIWRMINHFVYCLAGHSDEGKI